MLVRYIVSRPDQSLQLARKRRKSPEASVEALQRAQVALERESMRHADLFMADVPEGPTTCAVKLSPEPVESAVRTMVDAAAGASPQCSSTMSQT